MPRVNAVTQIDSALSPPSVESLINLRNAMIGIYQALPGRIEEVQFEIKRRTRTSDEEYELTERQKEVLHYVRAKMSNKEIGSMLNITERTVKFHLSRVYAKFKVQTRRELL